MSETENPKYRDTGYLVAALSAQMVLQADVPTAQEATSAVQMGQQALASEKRQRKGRIQTNREGLCARAACGTILTTGDSGRVHVYITDVWQVPCCSDRCARLVSEALACSNVDVMPMALQVLVRTQEIAHHGDPKPKRRSRKKSSLEVLH